MESSTRQISVKTITGEVKVVQVGPHVPVSEFKAKVSEAFNIPIDKQRLICQGKLLKDEHLISEYVKEDGQTVHLMIRADDDRPSNNPPPNPPPQNVNNPPPLQIDQMIASMMNNFFPGAQMFSSNQVLLSNANRAPNLSPNVPLINNASNPLNVLNRGPSSNPLSNNPPSGNPLNPPPQASNPPLNPANSSGQRNPIEITLPFDRIQNIGNIVNDLHGPSSSFPPPRMPQIPLQRNPLVLLGGFLYNYQFQLLRLLPFISRVADLLQRESLITDPQERLLLQQLASRVGSALNELNLATAPVTGMLQNIQIGPGPGQFQLRLGNIPVASEIRVDVPAPVPNPLQVFQALGQNLQGSNPLQMFQSLGQNLQGSGQNPQNLLAGFIPMITQMLGGNQNMTLRELLNSLQMHDEEESLPMMEFFYNLNLNEIIGFASGNWEPIVRQRPTVRESLLRLMESDSVDGRLRIVSILLDYMQRQYVVPPSFTSLINPGFSADEALKRIGGNWLKKLVDLVMDYNGSNFANEFRQTLELMIGNYAEEVSRSMQGGINNVLQMIQLQIQNGMARIVPPEFNGLIGGAMTGILSGYITRAVNVYNQ